MDNDLPETGFGESPSLITAEELKTWILEETPDFYVINKPGWVVCHPSKNGPWSSLVGALREYSGRDRLHLVSRLDRETSGLVIVAKNHGAASRLQTAFARRNTRKEYWAILVGSLAEFRRTESVLERDTASPVAIKQRVSFGRGKLAVTEFEPCQQGKEVTLCRIIPDTGRKHQIRAHAAWLEHPVLGDKIYGPDAGLYLKFIENGFTEELRTALKIPRQALHASRLEVWGEDWRYVFHAPMTEDFATWIREAGMENPEVEQAPIEKV